LGTLGGSWLAPLDLRDALRLVRQRTDAPFCVNLVLAFDQRERAEVAVSEGTPWISFSWGTSKELVSLARAAARACSWR
jgi:hypothetical protein